MIRSSMVLAVIGVCGIGHASEPIPYKGYDKKLLQWTCAEWRAVRDAVSQTPFNVDHGFTGQQTADVMIASYVQGFMTAFIWSDGGSIGSTDVSASTNEAIRRCDETPNSTVADNLARTAAAVFGSKAEGGNLLQDGFAIEVTRQPYSSRKGSFAAELTNITNRVWKMVTAECSAFDAQERGIGSWKLFFQQVPAQKIVSSDGIVPLDTISVECRITSAD